MCEYCLNLQTASWPTDIVPGQDLGVRLQAFLGWLNNYEHLPYEKQQEMLWELGQVEIGVGTLVATNQRLEQAIKPSVLASSNPNYFSARKANKNRFPRVKPSGKIQRELFSIAITFSFRPLNTIK